MLDVGWVAEKRAVVVRLCAVGEKSVCEHSCASMTELIIKLDWTTRQNNRTCDIHLRQM